MITTILHNYDYDYHYVLFSNALDTDKAIEIQRYAENRVNF